MKEEERELLEAELEEEQKINYERENFQGAVEFWEQQQAATE